MDVVVRTGKETMTALRQSRRPIQMLVVATALGAVFAGCDSSISPSPLAPRLRIVNNGPAPVRNLTVLFPKDQITFGDVRAGSSTGYKPVPNGV